MNNRMTWILVIVAIACMGADPGKDALRNASKHVADGIEYFRQKAWDDADKAFAEADVELPEDPRIAFNRGCVALAQGETDKAIDLFRQSVVSSDQRTVADSHYNLGNAYSAQARVTFGEQPELADAKTREKGLERLQSAVRHLRNALETDPQHQAARKNLEMIRLWIKHMGDLWAERDRQKRRDEMNLLQFLAWMQETQESIRELSKPLSAQPRSPRRFYALMALAEQQKLLRDERSTIDEKIEDALAPQDQPAPGGQTSPPSPEAGAQRKQAIEQLKSISKEAGEAMDVAVGDLQRRTPKAAVDGQKRALGHLERLFVGVAPFGPLLDLAKAKQKRAISDSELLTDDSGASDDSAEKPATTSADGSDVKDSSSRDTVRDAMRSFATDDLPWRQQTTTQAIQWLAQRAQVEREQLRKQMPTPTPDDSLQDEPPAASSPADKQAPASPEQQQVKAMLETMDKAVELAPQAVKESQAAEDDIKNEDYDAALAHQQEVLRLLNEMDKRPPQEKDQQDEQNKDEQNKDEQNKDEQNKDEQNKDEQNKDEQNKDEQNKDEQNKDEQNKDEQNKDEQQKQNKDANDKKQDERKDGDEQKKKSASGKREQLDQQQAEAILQRARERERDYRDRKRRLLKGGRIRVDKDW